MKCDVCENEATVFLTQIINGQMTTVNLCDACSKAKGVTDEAGFGLAEAFLSSHPPSSHTAPEPACEACGFTASQLKKIGRMGCPECYNTFREGLDNLLRAMHKGTTHKGKVPARTSLIPDIPPPVKRPPPPASSEPPAQPPPAPQPQLPAKPTVVQLREQLENAVREERYEDAAALKKEIDRLNEASGSPPPPPST
jgi:protein arginine kinase activator